MLGDAVMQEFLYNHALSVQPMVQASCLEQAPILRKPLLDFF